MFGHLVMHGLHRGLLSATPQKCSGFGRTWNIWHFECRFVPCGSSVAVLWLVLSLVGGRELEGVILQLMRGGGKEKFRTPSSLFGQNLAHVSGKGSSIPLTPPKKILKENILGGGEGGSMGLGGQLHFFLEQLSFSYLALFLIAMALHTM